MSAPRSRLLLLYKTELLHYLFCARRVFSPKEIAEFSMSSEKDLFKNQTDPLPNEERKRKAA
jgi:hypothetical protein